MNRRGLRFIAVLETAGGTYALLAGLYVLATLGIRALLPVTVLIAGGALSAWAGTTLWRGEPRGIRLSRLVQAIQLVQVALPGVAFVAVLGASIVIGLNAGPFTVRASLEPEVRFAFWSHRIPLRLELNVLALLCLIALQRVGARIEASVAPAATEPRVV